MLRARALLLPFSPPLASVLREALNVGLKRKKAGDDAGPSGGGDDEQAGDKAGPSGGSGSGAGASKAAPAGGAAGASAGAAARNVKSKMLDSLYGDLSDEESSGGSGS